MNDNTDTSSQTRNRRNTMGATLPALREVLGDLLDASPHPHHPHPNDWPRRSSWHGRLPASPETYVDAIPTTQYGYSDTHQGHYYHDVQDRGPYYHQQQQAQQQQQQHLPPTLPPLSNEQHYSPSLDSGLRLPPLMYSPSSSIPESPLERSPGPYPPSSRENSPEAGGGCDGHLQQQPLKLTLKRRKRAKTITVVPCTIEPQESRSPPSFSTSELPESEPEPFRTVKIEVSGTREGKLVYELDIPESLIKYDLPMPASPYDPHPCILCGHVFVSERHMNRHLLTHTDIKPYQCNQCGKPFSRPDSMIRHKRNVHGSTGDSPMTPLGHFASGDQSPPTATLSIPLALTPGRVPHSPTTQTQGLGLNFEYDT